VAKAKARKRNALVRYLQDTRVELKKVNWPTRQETWRLTQIVVVVTASMALFLWLMDLFFSWWLKGVLESNPWHVGATIAVLVVAVIVGIVLDRRRE